MYKEYFEVRDSEVDIQGIVNHTNYMIYLGHARHKYIQQLGIDFNAYAKRGQHFVLIDCNLRFKQSLKPHDVFYVTCRIAPSKSPVRLAFEQEIRLKESDKLILTAYLTTTCVNTQPKPGEKKIYIPEELNPHYEKCAP